MDRLLGDALGGFPGSRGVCPVRCRQRGKTRSCSSGTAGRSCARLTWRAKGDPPETVVDASSTMEGIPMVDKHQEGLRHTAEKPSSIDNFVDLWPAHLNGLLQSHRCKSWHDTPLGAVIVTGMAADSASNLTSTCSGVNPGPSSRAMSPWMVARKEAAKSLFAESIERFRFCAMMKRLTAPRLGSSGSAVAWSVLGSKIPMPLDPPTPGTLAPVTPGGNLNLERKLKQKCHSDMIVAKNRHHAD